MDKKEIDTDRIARLIFNSLDSSESREDSITSSMGIALRDRAKRSVLETTPQSDDNTTPEMVSRIKELKLSENGKDLCWMDYSSWNSLAESTQNIFVAAINPLFWGGVFFERSKLLLVEKELWSLISNTTVISELYEQNTYRIYVMDSDLEDSIFDRMNINRFREEKKHFDSKLIRSIAKLTDGTLKIKSFEKVLNE